MSKEPLISVGLPAYNGEKYIRDAIRSVLSQTYKNLELIISDDASSDATELICREFAKNDSRIIYFRQEKNLGGFLNYNFILKKSRGFFFTLIAQDDMLEENFLERTAKYLNQNTDCIVVSGDFEIIDESGSTIRVDKLEKIRGEIEWSKRVKEFFKYPLSKTFFCIYGLTRTDVLREVYSKMKFPKKIFKGSEMPLLTRLAVKGEIVSLPMTLRKYRQHGLSAYNLEVKKVGSKKIIKRKFILLKNLYEIRIDQLKVLFGSNYPISQKIYIFTSVYFGYAKAFLSRIFRAPKKLLILLTEKTQ